MPSCATNSSVWMLGFAIISGCASSEPQRPQDEHGQAPISKPQDPAGPRGDAPKESSSGAGTDAVPTANQNQAGTGAVPMDVQAEAGTYADWPERLPWYDRNSGGRDACSNTTLGRVILSIQEARPELSDIVSLWDPDHQAEGASSIRAFLRRDGGFSLVFRRGNGDCIAGCINNEYWYFDTGELCAAQQVGHFKRTSTGGCFEEEGSPLWDQPHPTDKTYVCNASQAPEAISGSYHFRAQGQGMPCARSGEMVQANAIDAIIQVEIKQVPDQLERGTLTVHGVGHALIDDQALTASFHRRQVQVHDHRSNAPDRCQKDSTLDITYDFEGIAPSQIELQELDTPDCNNPDDYCKAFWHLTLTPMK